MADVTDTGVRSGLDLARAFYRDAVAPLLGDLPHSAALLGDGSEVLGYDDDTSTDHGFGPRLQLFIADGDDPGPLDAELARWLDSTDVLSNPARCRDARRVLGLD